MLKLLDETGNAKNIYGQKEYVKYHLLSKQITLGNALVIEHGSIKLTRVIKKEYEEDSHGMKFAEYGLILGIIASVGAIMIGSYSEPADFILGFLVNIVIYGFLGWLIGGFFKTKSLIYTFEIMSKHDDSVWVIRCHQVLFDVFSKYAGNIDSEISRNDSSSIIMTKVENVNQETSNTNAADQNTIVMQFEKFYDLLQKGVITEDEFKDLKKKLIAGEIK